MIAADRAEATLLWIPAALLYLGSALIDYLLSVFVLISLILISLAISCFSGCDEPDEWADW